MEKEVQSPPKIPTPTSSPTNWSRILLFTLLGLIIVAGFVYASIQIGKKQNTNLQSTTLQVAVTPTIIKEPTTLITSVTLQKNDNVCPIELNDSKNKKVTVGKNKCNFVMLHENGESYFGFDYPKGWKSNLVGALDANIALTDANNNVAFIDQTVTRLPYESIEQAEICYESCSPIVDPDEVMIAKSTENYGDMKILKLKTSVKNETKERLFYLTNKIYENGTLLLIIEFKPISLDYENQFIDLLKSFTFAN